MMIRVDRVFLERICRSLKPRQEHGLSRGCWARTEGAGRPAAWYEASTSQHGPEQNHGEKALNCLAMSIGGGMEISHVMNPAGVITGRDRRDSDENATPIVLRRGRPLALPPPEPLGSFRPARALRWDSLLR
jgi:hypothetical protein